MKQAIKKIPLYYPVRNWAARRRYATELIEWERRGKPVPPSHGVKQRTLREYSVKYGIKVLVETGTFYGEMIEAMKNVFDQLYSIELGAASRQVVYEDDRRVILVA